MSKKILLLADVNSSHTRKWVSGVAGLGYDVALFSMSKPDDNWCEKNNIRLLNDSFLDKNIFSSGSFSKIIYFRFAKELKAGIRSFPPDIIHAHYATSYGMLGRFSRIHPFLLSAWGSDVFDFPRRSFLHRWMLRRIFNSADLILSTSKIMKEEILRYTNKSVEVTPFGIDTGIYKKSFRNPEGIFRIGIIKSLETHYGIDFLIRAFDLVNRKYPEGKFELVICGKGSKTEEYEKLVENSGLKTKVVFTGRINQDDVPAMLNTFDVFVCPSLHESFGVSVLEASACEVPVIVSNSGGLKEVAIDGKTGIMVKPGSAEEIASAISYFIEHPDEISIYGRRGREFVLDHYDWKKNLLQISDIYRRY